MKNKIMGLVVLLCAGLTTSCAPTASQLKKTIEENPDILFNAIEKHPSAFLESVNKAAQAAREVEEKKMQEDEGKRREEEFKNPKKPVISDDRAIKGNKSAPITIVEYSDFQCPFCQRGSQTVDRVMAEYGDKVRLIFKHFPIERIHPQARLASEYFEAIAMQDPKKAYDFKKMVFENQQDLPQEGKFLDSVAKKVGANVADVKKNLKSEHVQSTIETDKKEAESFGFSGTPGYMINGVSLKGAYPFEEFKTIIDKQLAKK